MKLLGFKEKSDAGNWKTNKKELKFFFLATKKKNIFGMPRKSSLINPNANAVTNSLVYIKRSGSPQLNSIRLRHSIKNKSTKQQQSIYAWRAWLVVWIVDAWVDFAWVDLPIGETNTKTKI